MAVTQSLTLTQANQNVASNYSKVRILWTSTQTYESWNGYTRTAKYYVSINGGAETEYSVSYTLPKGTTKTILDIEITVNHKSDGTGNVKVRTWMDTDISAGVVTQSKTLTLATIPRATVPELSSTSVNMGSKVNITLPRASSSFTHDLAYSFAGGGYVTIKTGVTTSYEWTTPDLATRIPKAASGTLTLRCITKNGGTTIGTKTVTMTLKVPSDVVPTISKVTVTEATAGLAAQFGAFIKDKSILDVAITAAGAKGSTIKAYSSTFQGLTYPGEAWTSNVLTSSGDLSIVTTVTDTRDRTVKVTTKIPGVLGYTPPEVTGLRVYRVDENAEPDTEGTGMGVELAYNVALLNNKNTAKLLLEYKLQSASEDEWAELDSLTALAMAGTSYYDGPFSSDYQYDVRAILTDWFGTRIIYRATPLPSGQVILDVASDGRGLGIGTVSQQPGLQVAWLAQMSGGYRPLVLPASTDADTLLAPNSYAGYAYANYQHIPVTDKDFTLEVLPAGAAGQLLQRLTTCVPLAPVTYTRFYVSGAWQAWFISGFESIWQAAALTSGFKAYGSAYAPQYRRSGGTVELRGDIAPASDIAAGADWQTITTLPEGYRPGGPHAVYHVCQGGGNHLWLLRITTAGAVQFARYQNGGENAAATAGTRLPFNVTFLADR